LAKHNSFLHAEVDLEPGADLSKVPRSASAPSRGVKGGGKEAGGAERKRKPLKLKPPTPKAAQSSLLRTHGALVFFMARDAQPLDALERPGLRGLLQALCPTYAPPSQHALRKLIHVAHGLVRGECAGGADRTPQATPIP
jgi:hypothetical protein